MWSPRFTKCMVACMVGLDVLPLAVCGYRDRDGVLNQILDQRMEMMGTKDDDITRFEENWYNQTLDHFQEAGSEKQNKTWRQRYFVNDHHYKAGGPVFLMIGGEGAISGRYVSDSAFITGKWAKDYNGLVLGVEHRFYGSSQPFETLATENLKYLTSRQALADLDTLTAHIRKTIKGTNDSPWFCFGGSYPGNLAAWYKQQYPKNTKGCFAFSAPVLAKSDFFEYGQMVRTALASHGHKRTPERLFAGYNQVRSRLVEGTLGAKRILEKDIHACRNSVISKEDRANVEAYISGSMAGIVQYNNTKRSFRIEDVQKTVEASPLSDLALAIELFNNQTMDERRKNDTDADCTDFSTRASFDEMDKVTPSAMRSWVYQTCNEFGYFQNGRESIDHETLYTSGVSDPSLSLGICEEVFGIPANKVEERIEETNTFYGALDADVDHTIFINGEYDPWSLLSHREPKDKWTNAYAFLVKDGSHCVGLYQLKSQEEHPDAWQTQTYLAAILEYWISEEKKPSATIYA